MESCTHSINKKSKGYKKIALNGVIHTYCDKNVVIYDSKVFECFGMISFINKGYCSVGIFKNNMNDPVAVVEPGDSFTLTSNPFCRIEIKCGSICNCDTYKPREIYDNYETYDNCEIYDSYETYENYEACKYRTICKCNNCKSCERHEIHETCRCKTICEYKDDYECPNSYGCITRKKSMCCKKCKVSYEGFVYIRFDCDTNCVMEW